MIRRIATVLAVSIAALLLSVGIASATGNYVPDPVTTSVLATTHSTSVQVLGTSQDIAGHSLSYTGAGFNLGLALAIGALVVLLGVGLTVVGVRMSRGRSNHS